MRRFVILSVIALVLAGAVIIVLSSSSPSNIHPNVHPNVGVQLAHAAGDRVGCAQCHSEPVAFKNCTDCHSAPKTYVTDQKIYLVHHDPKEAPDEVTCQSCHQAVQNDARYVKVPEASHTFCGSCHSPTHTEK